MLSHLMGHYTVPTPASPQPGRSEPPPRITKSYPPLYERLTINKCHQIPIKYALIRPVRASPGYFQCADVVKFRCSLWCGGQKDQV